MVFELVKLSDSGFLNINNEAVEFLKNINDEIVLVTFLSSTNDNDDMNSIKIQLISNLLNEQINDENNNGVSMISKLLTNKNSNAKIIFCNIHTSNKYLLSLMFLVSSLFVFCVKNELNETQINKFKEIPKLPTTIEMNNKNNREVILIESSPKCLFYISKSNLNPIENLPRDYLDNYLRSKEEVEINLIKDSIIKFFPDRDCIFDNQENVFTLLKNKIIRDLHTKNIRGKLFDGKSLIFFLKEYITILSKGENPNFDSLWNNVIKNDINEFKNNALNSYNKNLLSLNDNLNEEELIKSLYNFKVDAMDKLNDIFKINVDTFNNNEYLSWFNEVKRELEEKIEENEEQKININNETINQFNKKLLNENYQTIKDKVNKKYYNSSNINEYLKDYEDFINEYNKKGLGNNKLKILIDFITENKPDFIQKFMNELENENVEKLKEVNKKLEENNELKKNAEEEFKELNDKTDENSKKIEDLNSAIEKKKRQIKTLNEEIERVENDMKKARKEDISTDKINTNNTNQSMNESNNDLSRNQKI